MKLIFDKSITIATILFFLGAKEGDAGKSKGGSYDGEASKGTSKSGSKSGSESGHCPNDICPPITPAFCSSLKYCWWEGMDKDAVGDGHCDRHACYNTKVCDYDGGDCCPETCEAPEGSEWECGEYGYDCKADPPKPEECRCKKIKIYRFCADGTLDDDIEGKKLFLKLNAMEHGSIHPVRSGMCYEVNEMDEDYKIIDEDMIFKSLTVGIAPQGAGAGFLGVTVSSKEWFDPTCKPYEVRIARDYEGEKTRNVCINRGGQTYGEYLKYNSHTESHGGYWGSTDFISESALYRNPRYKCVKRRCNRRLSDDSSSDDERIPSPSPTPLTETDSSTERPTTSRCRCVEYVPKDFLDVQNYTYSEGKTGGLIVEGEETYSVGGSFSHGTKGCSSWVDPPNSYIWFIEVHPCDENP